MFNTPAILRMPDVCRAVGLHRNTIYRLIKAREFPAAIHLTARSVGWAQSDIESWLELRRSAEK
jgi:prophage regulatory protein